MIVSRHLILIRVSTLIQAKMSEQELVRNKDQVTWGGERIFKAKMDSIDI